MNDEPFTYFVEAAQSTVGGVISFIAGLIGGTIIVDFQSYHTAETFWLCFVLWPLLVASTIAHLWGLILAFFLAIMLYGLVWKEWNRLIGTSSIAIATSATWMLCEQENPFRGMETRINFCISMGLAFGLLLIGTVYEYKKKTQPISAGGVAERIAPETCRLNGQKGWHENNLNSTIHHGSHHVFSRMFSR